MRTVLVRGYLKEWSEVAKKRGTAAIEEITTRVRLEKGKKGRIVCFRVDARGKIGYK